jgi:hypothetical protein
VRLIYLMTTVLAGSASAFADTPADERDFGEFAAAGCKNRNGDFIIRGLVSSANEGTLVLSDPMSPRTTTSVTLPGGGGRSLEATNQTLSELRSSRTLVAVTMECKGEGTPIAKEISYTYLGGTHGAISFSAPE